MKSINILKTTTCALFTALGVVLPGFFHMFGLGQAFLPMHIPVLLCGLICGWYFGALCGLITPLLSSAVSAMPPLFPVATVMAFELMAYGMFCGILQSAFEKNVKLKKYSYILSLVISMIIGRIVYGIFGYALYSINGQFTFEIFINAAIINSIAGIVLQLVLVPTIMYTLKNLKILIKYKKNSLLTETKK